MANRKVLVTGAAGFIGAFLVKKLLEKTDDAIVGLDNLNSYYDPGIKDARLRMLAESDTDGRFTFVRGDLCDAALIERLFAQNGFDVVVNLAAQAGVRYSIENPRAYLESNLVGFFNILEACRHHPVKHMGLRQFQLGLRRQQEGAVLRGGPRGLAGFALRRHQEVQ